MAKKKMTTNNNNNNNNNYKQDIEEYLKQAWDIHKKSIDNAIKKSKSPILPNGKYRKITREMMEQSFRELSQKEQVEMDKQYKRFKEFWDIEF